MQTEAEQGMLWIVTSEMCFPVAQWTQVLQGMGRNAKDKLWKKVRGESTFRVYCSLATSSIATKHHPLNTLYYLILCSLNRLIIPFPG